MSDEIEPIGISLVLDDKVAEAIRRVSQEIARFSQQTEFSAAQMSRIARQHLGAYLPPEPERRKPAAAAVRISVPAKAQTIPATETPEVSKASWPMPRAQAPALSAAWSTMELKPPVAAMAAVPNPRPMRPPTPRLSDRQAPVVQPEVQQVPPQPRSAPAAEQAPTARHPAPPMQQVPPQPRPTPSPVVTATARLATVTQPVASPPPPSQAAGKPSARPKIQVALSTASWLSPAPARATPATAMPTAQPPTTAQGKSGASPPPPVARSAVAAPSAAVVRAPTVTSTPSPVTPPTPNTTPNLVIARRTPPAESAVPVATVAPPQTAANKISQTLPPTTVAPPVRLPIVPERGRSLVPPMPPSPAPQRPIKTAQQSAAAATTAAASQAAPAPAQTQMARVEGDVMLDGAQVGRWISSVMAKEAARPPTAARGFNTRMSPAWPGIPL